MYLANNIRHLRRGKKMTQSELGKAIGGKSHTMIGKYEMNQVVPTVDIIEKIAEVFEVETPDLMYKDLANPEVSVKREPNGSSSDRIIKLLEKELERLEELEAHIKRNPALMEAVRRHDVALWRKLGGE